MKTCSADCNDGTPCGNIVEGRTDYCAHHNRLFRKQASDEQKAAEKAEKTLKKAKLKQQQPRPKPKAVSDKRKELNKQYNELIKVFKAENPKCQARANSLCTDVTNDAHHKRGRGKYLLDVSTWLPVCRNCHIYIENHPEEAKERGWSESRLAVNQEKPVI